MNTRLVMFPFTFLGLNMLVRGPPKYENDVFSAIGERGGGEAKGSRRFKKSEGDVCVLELDGDGDLEGRGRSDTRLDSGWRDGRTAETIRLNCVYLRRRTGTYDGRRS